MSLTETIGHTVYRRPRYPTYRASGIDWLGDIPSHWKLKRLRMLARLNPSKQEIRGIPSEHHATFLPMELIGEDGALTLTETRAIGDVQNGYTYFRDGDVLIAKITPCFENGKGGLCRGLLNGIGFGTTEIHVVRVRAELDERFLYYVTRTDEFRKLGEASMYGAAGQQRVSEEFIKDFPVAYPDTEEQRAIVEFLDRETARIDALIAKKERLIELLQEKRTALISHAVTKGLDPTAPTRDSGIPWIGRIPAHWEVVPLKRTVSGCINGVWGSEPTASDNDVVCVRVADFDRHNYRVKLENPTIRFVEPQLLSTRELRNGDLLLEKSGGGESQPVGAVVIYEGGPKAVCSNFVARMRPREGFSPRFLCYAHAAIYSNRANIPHIKQTTGIQNLDSSAYLSLVVAVPPSREEQTNIADYLDKKGEEFEALRDALGRQIALLQEHRTALISAAVTGKIDVRGEVV